MEGMEDLMVQYLFIPRTREWDIELPQEISSTRDVHAIAKTPASFASGDDCLMWHYAKDGTYLVRSGYRISLSNRLTKPP